MITDESQESRLIDSINGADLSEKDFGRLLNEKAQRVGAEIRLLDLAFMIKDMVPEYGSKSESYPAGIQIIAYSKYIMGSGDSFSEAADNVRKKIKTPGEIAAEKRKAAEALLAEARELEVKA